VAVRPYDLWLDFNDVRADSRACTLLEYAPDPSKVVVGARILVGDDEGNRCEATVISVDAASELVELAVDGNTFNRERDGADHLVRV
jgi:hypothetical protein